MKPTLSVVIPALNEEENIAAATNEVIKTLDGRVADYELLLFNDGSRDRTGEIMDGLARSNPRIRVTHNGQSKNLGGVYKQGIQIASFNYIMMVPGDNENPGFALLPVLEAIGNADIIIPYTINAHERPVGRRIASRGFTLLMNILFGNHLKYYNGTVICSTADLRSITIKTNSFAYQSEVLLKLLKSKKSYVEIGVKIQPRPERDSKALKFGNLVNVCKAVAQLFVEIHFSGL